MSVKLNCGLCCTECNDYEWLQNEFGENNEVYDIAVKYFDPVLLTDDKSSKDNLELNVLCHDCWRHISDLHEFQKSILLKRNSREKCSNTISQMEREVKQELDKDNTPANHKTEDEPGLGFQSEKNHFRNYECFSHDNSLKNDDDDDDDGDDKPLITLRNWEDEKQLKSLPIQDKQEDDQSDVVVRIPESENFDRNEQALFEDDYLEIDNNKIQSRKSFHDIPIKTFCNEEEFVHEQIEKIEEESVSINSSEVEMNSEDKKLKKTKGTKEKESLYQSLEKSREADAIIAEWMPELVCDLCCKTANNFDELRRHFEENHYNTNFYTKCCERKFFRRDSLVNHIQLHLNPDIHKCDVCGHTSSNKYNLKQHKKFVHETTKPLKCDICGKHVKEKYSLKKHLLTHVTGNKDFICSECGKGFIVEQLLKIHIGRVHNLQHVCDQCGKTIIGHRALQIHLVEHGVIGKRQFACDECARELNSSNSLNRHKAAYHNDGTTIYVCGLCGKVAPNDQSLRNHKRTVHVERKHKCTYCKKEFKHLISLREHIAATHTGQDLYQCPHCPKRFKSASLKFRHRQKVHPVECEEIRKKRPQRPKIDISKEKKQIVIQ